MTSKKTTPISWCRLFYFLIQLIIFTARRLIPEPLYIFNQLLYVFNIKSLKSALIRKLGVLLY